MLVDYLFDPELREGVYSFRADVLALPRVGDQVSHRIDNPQGCGLPDDDFKEFDMLRVVGVVKRVIHRTRSAYVVFGRPALLSHDIEIELEAVEWVFRRRGSQSELYWDPELAEQPYGVDERVTAMAERAAKDST